MSDTPKLDALHKLLKAQGVEVGGFADRIVQVIDEFDRRIKAVEKEARDAMATAKWDGRIG